MDAHDSRHALTQLRVTLLLLSMGARGTQSGLLGCGKATQAVKNLRVVAWGK